MRIKRLLTILKKESEAEITFGQIRELFIRFGARKVCFFSAFHWFSGDSVGSLPPIECRERIQACIRLVLKGHNLPIC